MKVKVKPVIQSNVVMWHVISDMNQQPINEHDTKQEAIKFCKKRNYCVDMDIIGQHICK